MRRKLTILFFFVSLIAVGQDTLNADGNNLYASGRYIEALEAYSSLLQNNLTNKSRAVVLYNMGNSYYKMGELSQAILYYERSLRLYPRFKDARYNLRFAQNSITDNIEDNRTFISQWVVFLRNLLLEPVWTLISILSFLIFLIGMLFFAFSPQIEMRKLSFYTGVFCLILSAVSFANSYSLNRRDTLRNEAIITQGIVNAKSSPDKSGTDLFTLHEGTKVIIHETIGEWVNIHVGNNIGWIAVSNLERI